jgi:ligand-binding sensor domain-containing protein
VRKIGKGRPMAALLNHFGACLMLAMAICQALQASASVGAPLVALVADGGQIQNGIVTALAEDRQGFIWVGTQAGLLRYDGYHFRRFALRHQVTGSQGGIFVRRLWMAPDGRLWVGTNSDGVRTLDRVARWRGEEFIFLLPETSLENARVVAEQCRVAVAAAEECSGELRLRVTMTLGVSAIRAGESIDQCTRRADEAMYAGKRNGRNRVEFSTP